MKRVTVRSWFRICWPSWFMLDGIMLINVFGSDKAHAHILSTLFSLEGWTLKAESLTWLFLLMLPPIKVFQRCVAHADGFGCKRLPPEREELHSAPVQTVTSAIDHFRSSTSAILRSYLSSDRTRHRRLSDIFIDIKTMNTNTSALDTWSRDTIKAFLLDF